MRKLIKVVLGMLAMAILPTIIASGGASAVTVSSEWRHDDGTLFWTYDLNSDQEVEYNRWTSNFRGYTNIDSVRWAAVNKALYPDSNVCSLWIGPMGNASATVIDISDPTKIGADGNYQLSFYGMCTNNGTNQAVDVTVSGDFVEYVPTVVERNPYWSGPRETSNLWINVERFRSAASIIASDATTTTYQYITTVYRCHAIPGTNTSNGNCAPDNVPIILKIKSSYAAASNVSNSVGGYASTGIRTSSATARTDTGIATVGQEVTLVFSHNVYSTNSVSSASWNFTRSSSLSSGSGYTITRKSSSVGRNPASLTKLDGGYYAAENRPGTDGANSYIVREEYTVVFATENRSVEFCESINIQGITTTACTTLRSSRGVVGACDTWAAEAGYTSSRPGYYNIGTGTTSVLSKVTNGRSDGGSTGWKGSVNGNGVTYAKPGDTVKWINCYYPGAQYYYNADVLSMWSMGNYVGLHAAEIGCGCTMNIYAKLRDYVQPAWSNVFRIGTTSPYGFNDGNILITNAAKTYDPGTLQNGDYTVRTVINNYALKYTNVGSGYGEFYDRISSTASPRVASIRSAGTHSWDVVCCSKSECGEYDCSYTDNDGVYHQRTCCISCTVTRHHCNPELIGSYTANYGLNSQADVKVPYNFINTASLTLSSSHGEVVYAGETATVGNTQVTTSMRLNSTVSSAPYATIVRNAQVKLIAYVSGSNESGAGARYASGAGANLCGSVSVLSGQCDAIGNSGSITLNGRGNLSGATNGSLSSTNGDSFNGLYNVYDANAGNYFCVAIGVYPYTSGADTNMNASGDNTWYISSPSCKVVAKRPTFQVWGGNLYSAGGIKTSIMSKTNIAGAYSYCGPGSSSALCIAKNALNSSNTTVFGSWVDQGVISNGVVTLLASGAGTGRSSVGIGSGSLEGRNTDYCNNRTSLSFANYGSNAAIFGATVCPYNKTSTGSAGISSSTIDRASLVSYWVPADASPNVGTSVNLNYSYSQLKSATGRDIRYAYSGSDLSVVGDLNLGANTTYIVRASGDINLNSNIRYNTTSWLGSTGAIPKVVIYAGKNVTIACNVSEIDAIIIAEGNVNTCGGLDVVSNLNSGSRSQGQLMVRGMVIANSLTLPRTWGAAKGAASDVAAEVINYDTSAVLWGRYMAGSAESDTLTVTYQHELAPRY